jgi:hypothetical protein
LRPAKVLAIHKGPQNGLITVDIELLTGEQFKKLPLKNIQAIERYGISIYQKGSHLPLAL